MASPSLRTRLILLVLVALLPALAAALWVVHSIYEREHAGLRRQLQDTTRALSLVIDRELASRLQLARTLADSPFLDPAPELPREDGERFYQQALRASEDIGGWVQLSSREAVLIDAGPAGAATPLPAGAASAVPPFAEGDPLLSPLRQDARSGRLLASVQAPVVRQERTLLNVGVTLLPEELQRIVEAQRLPAGWTTAVIDAERRIVARMPRRFIGESATATMAAQLQSGPLEGYFEARSLDGTESVAFFSKSPAYDWAFVIAVPRTAFELGVRRALLQTLAAMGVVGLISAATLLWVLRGIARPIHTLRHAAGRLGRGEVVPLQPTGLQESDEVHQALTDASERILDAQRHLEAEVAQAVQQTREAQQRLAQSQRIEALGRLTGGVAHDFNHLLAVVGNNLFLLRRLVPEGQAAAQRIVAIQRAVDLGSRLTQHLLRFSRQQAVKPVVLAPAEQLRGVAELLRTVVGSAVDLRIEAAADTAPVRVDAAELELALLNLALNARDAMQGGGRLAIVARNARPDETSELPPGEHVLIAVADSGPGIPPGLRERVFEPFFTTKEIGKGTGLGLSQVHGFCAQAGGMARIAEARAWPSADGRAEPGAVAPGTVIELVLPAAKGELPAAPPAPPAVLPGEQGRLLLVEDNEALGDVTEELLARLGYSVARARRVDEALALVSRETWDVVLSDVVMPGGLSGIDLARTLRARAGSPPVVLISGYTATLADTDEFDVLQKPCPPELLAARLQQAVAGQAARPAPPQR